MSLLNNAGRSPKSQISSTNVHLNVRNIILPKNGGGGQNKENMDVVVEKNVRRSILADQQNIQRRSALRPVLCAKTPPTTTRSNKQIRFNLSNKTEDSPPPKEFKRMGQQRKTLRNDRCVSVFVTEKERQAVLTENNKEESPRPPQGFVRSMCKFYNFGQKSKSSPLNRSNSFSGQNEKTEKAEIEPRGSLRLFRSRSWSLRRKKDSQSSPISEENRSSPSYSTKSQDSGFSDSAESRSSLNNQRLQFLRTNMEVTEDEQDPNLTQMPEIRPKKVRPISGGGQQNARKKVEQSLGNIASIQEGFRLKRSMADDEAGQLPEVSLRQRSASNLLMRSPAEKIRPKSFQESVHDLSQEADSAAPVFSTPVRASFRRRSKLQQPMTSIHLEDAKTPMKREGKTRLKEFKNRRWSAHADLHADLSRVSYGRVIERSDIPEDIDPSMVAQWSQFLNYEPSIPQLSAVDQHSAGQQQQLLTSEEVCVDDHLSAMSELGQLSSTQLSDITFRQGNGELLTMCADHQHELTGMNRQNLNGTQAEEEASFINNHTYFLQCSLRGEEALIELDSVRNTPKMTEKTSPKLQSTSPVCEWWRDLHAWCEPECMTYLQSKPIQTMMSTTSSTASSSSPSTAPSSPLAAAAAATEFFSSTVTQPSSKNPVVDAIKKMQRGAKAVKVTFSSLNSHMQSLDVAQIGKTVQALLSQVQQYIYDYNLGRTSSVNSQDYSNTSSSTDWNFPGLRKNVAFANIEMDMKSADLQGGTAELLMLQQRTVLQTVDRLKLCAHRCQYTHQQPLNEMTRVLGILDRSFDKMVSKMYTKELKPIIREIDHPSSPIALRSALHTVIALGNEAGMNGSNSGNIVCAHLSREGCVRALLKQSNQSNQRDQDVRILALRGLSAICCVAECIREFEQCGGLRVIDELLSNRGSSIEDRIESAGVLAQITSPWISDNHKIHQLDNHVLNMVNALTGLSRLNGGEETFLLVTAALANLTFMSPLTSAAMKRCGTPEALVKAVKRSPFTTQFAKDQVVTVLANMAANANCRHDIEVIGGVGFLLTMLETKISCQFSPAELSAVERVQKKSAIALSRLCNSTSVCRDLLRLGGADRLVELCRQPEERNYSDAVLVSCLAVLRRLHANLQDNDNADDDHELVKVLKQLKAADLVRPNLVDSFMEYSTKQESYV